MFLVGALSMSMMRSTAYMARLNISGSKFPALAIVSPMALIMSVVLSAARLAAAVLVFFLYHSLSLPAIDRMSFIWYSCIVSMLKGVSMAYC
ncbi:hypothetical protein ASD97_26080 [Streptomyces sp. Root63]|nr:hypothetical protein ASD29_32380 [Streptomyces sp. Root1295]KRA34103.1 hypothetical protein ASD97_26080 [Streptomyces sp. Root63]